jgi:endonuclease G, mitochondrial
LARKRSKGKPSGSAGDSGGAMWIVILALLIVGGVLVYIAWKRQQEQQPPLPVAETPIVADKIVFGGLPRPAPGAGSEVEFTLLKNQAYYVGYSESRRDPLWAAYRVFRTETPFNFPRPSGFDTDPRTLAKVKSSDYTGSGYDRGHMAPNSAIMRGFGKDAQLETFYLSNICPQSPELNQNVWERLEIAEKKYADEMEEVWVIAGPIFADLNGGETPRLRSGVAVPSAFYKIVVDEEGSRGGKPRIFSVIMPQNVKGTELPQEFVASVDQIEQQTRFDFFPAMDEAMQTQMESVVFKMW